MKNLKKFVALFLALAMCVCVFAACNGNKKPEDSTNNANPGNTATNDKPLVVGYSNFNEKFSPFFSETAYDQDVYAMTALALLNSDRTGAVIQKGIEGETIAYNGTDYTYYGPADLTITEDEATGYINYDFKLRDDITFSDGEKITVDDVIFSMYVLCDPTYDGASTLFAVPILGMNEYRAGMDTLLNLIFKAGKENTDFTYFTEEQQTAFWTAYDAATLALANEIIDFCIEAGYAEDAAGAAAAWGFAGANSAEDLAAMLTEAYGADVAGMINTENAGSTVEDLFPNLTDYSTVGVKTGDSAAKIEGIQKIDDYNMRVVLTEVDATAIYQLGVVIAPLHYYGNDSLFDYDNNKFGFEKGDLSSVRAKTTVPMGAGPYKFLKYENGVVYFEANETYYRGTPKTKYINFIEGSDADKLNGIVTGTIDITDPSFSADTVKAIKAANGLAEDADEVSGSKITVNTVDNLGYGYIGMSADSMNVGGVKDSEASKNLRKAFATVLAVYRDVAIDSYYGERASVINYPISNTSWAAPQATDADYKVAFSTDVNGKAIYTSDMDTEARYAAALEAALGYFEAAGYTVENGKVTAAPEGASTSYELWIPADGQGDHPSFMIVTLASEALAKIGVELIVKDLANSDDLWDGIEAGNVPMWCAAWQATVDPDMYQIYFSGNDNQAAGGSNYMYDIADEELNKLILAARASFDQSYRKTVYKQCLDIVVDWAVEIPVYQRQNAVIFSTERVNMATVTPDITTFYGWMSEIENTELN
ncbi:MAG: ABC transporter substrate-binding protein [Oscillospiraceae bacterium]|nr:ABC transporter substrate-binding protein [Oscillospiraceae bacterium]